MKLISLFLVSILVTIDVSASGWLSSLADQDRLAKVGAVYAKANVTVSDGKQYQVETIWLDQERAILHMVYPDTQQTLGREGHLYWSSDGSSQTDLNDEYRHFITGHQYHAQLLNFSQFDTVTEPVLTSDKACDCLKHSITDVDENIITMEYQEGGMPLRQVTQSKRFGEMIAEYHDWRKSDGIMMPHQILITHDGIVYDYRYEVLAFNQEQHFRRLSPSLGQLTDKQKILRLHRLTMDAHIASDASLMTENWAEEILIVNRGEFIETTAAAAAERMTTSLAMRKHSRYIDLVKPRVTISDDGTLGWLAVQVYAEGVTVAESPVEFNFTSAWIATFSKQNGVWRMTANASNFKG